jgi:hypothetical protein
MSLMDFVVPPPGCGRSVTDFWGWDVHEAQLRCPVRWMVIYQYEVPGWSLNPSPTTLPRPWESSPSRKNPNARTGNRTRDLMISSQKLWALDHEARRRWHITLEITRFADFARRVPHFCTRRNFFRMVVGNSVHLKMLRRQKPIDAVSLRLRSNHIEFKNKHKVSDIILLTVPVTQKSWTQYCFTRL